MPAERERETSEANPGREAVTRAGLMNGSVARRQIGGLTCETRFRNFDGPDSDGNIPLFTIPTFESIQSINHILGQGRRSIEAPARDARQAGTVQARSISPLRVDRRGIID